MRRNQRGRPWNKATKAQLASVWERKWAFPALIAQHRQALATKPDDLAARYLLANCLHADGQREAAEMEWETVAQIGDTEWTETVRETRAVLARYEKNR